MITFCLLKNHFHILLHVDPERVGREEVTDLELLRRFRALYGGKRLAIILGVDATPRSRKPVEEDGRNEPKH